MRKFRGVLRAGKPTLIFSTQARAIPVQGGIHKHRCVSCDHLYEHDHSYSSLLHPPHFGQSPTCCALQARASRRNMEPMAHATNYYPQSTAYRQSAPVRQSGGVPFDYATVRPPQPPPQRQATVCSCCSGLHPAETCRFKYAICNYCLQEAHIERACDLKRRALAFRMSRQTSEPEDRFDGSASQNQPANTTWRGGRNWNLSLIHI